MGDVILPLTLTDASKALKEIFDMAKEAGAGFNYFVQARKRRRHRLAARALSHLRFAPKGLRKSIASIAYGTGLVRNLDSVEAQLYASSYNVERSIKSLEKYSDLLREEIGLNAVEQLEDLLDNPSFGKRNIRWRLRELSSLDPKDDRTAVIADDLMGCIDQLNGEIRKLHDLILSHGKAQTSS